MNNIIKKEIIELLYTKELDYTKKAVVTYMSYETQETDKRDIKTIRNLKLGELIDDEDNNAEIKILEETPFFEDIDYTEEMNIILPSINTINITLNKFINIESKDDKSIKLTNDIIKKQILTEIYKISDKNTNILKHSKGINFDIDIDKHTKMITTANKIISKILMISNYIAVESRVGTANTCIMNSNYYHIINNTIEGSITTSIAGINIIIDNNLKDKIIVYRSPKRLDQINNNIILPYYYDDEANELYYSINKIGLCINNYFEININNLVI